MERIFAFRVTGQDGTIHAFGFTCDEERAAVTACGLEAAEMPVTLGGDPNCVVCRRALESAHIDGDGGG